MEQWEIVQLRRLGSGDLSLVVDTSTAVPSVLWIGADPGAGLGTEHVLRTGRLR